MDITQQVHSFVDIRLLSSPVSASFGPSAFVILDNTRFSTDSQETAPGLSLNPLRPDLNKPHMPRLLTVDLHGLHSHIQSKEHDTPAARDCPDVAMVITAAPKFAVSISPQ